MRAGATGLGIAVFSAATFGTSGTFADSLMTSGWTPGGAVIVRIGLAALVLSVPAMVALRGRWHLLRRNVSGVFAYGMLAVAGCQLCYFNAVEHLSVGVALLLEYSGILLVMMWMWLRHGQRPSRLTVAGGLFALAGLVLVLDLTGPQRIDLIGILWGLGAAAGLATYFVLSARTTDAADTVPPVAMAWAGMTLGVLTLAVAALVGAVPFGVASTSVHIAGHTVSWVLPVLGLAIVSTVVAYTSGIAAARRLGARVASFVGLAEVLFAIFFAWVLLGQQPGPLQLVGGVVVLVGIALVRTDATPDTDPAVDTDPVACAAALSIPLAGAGR